MHMPRHILLQKLAEMAAKEQAQNPSKAPAPEQPQPDSPQQPDKPGKGDPS
ncbi:YycC family protein [Escherichia coli]|uniref:YycC family protein n=1 Tax=Escherichia coli TaxID=562 RepID=UPI0032EA4C6C